MYLIGIVVYFVGLLFTMTMKGLPFSMLVNPAAIALLLFAVAAVLTATQGFKVFAGGMKAAAFPKKPLTEDMRGKAASLFRLLSKMVALAAVAGLLLSVMAAFASMQEPEILAHALVSAFVAPLWGLFLIAAVFEPVVFILKKRQDAERQSKMKD